MPSEEEVTPNIYIPLNIKAYYILITIIPNYYKYYIINSLNNSNVSTL